MPLQRYALHAQEARIGQALTKATREETGQIKRTKHTHTHTHTHIYYIILYYIIYNVAWNDTLLLLASAYIAITTFSCYCINVHHPASQLVPTVPFSRAASKSELLEVQARVWAKKRAHRWHKADHSAQIQAPVNPDDAQHAWPW